MLKCQQLTIKVTSAVEFCAPSGLKGLHGQGLTGLTLPGLLVSLRVSHEAAVR